MKQLCLITLLLLPLFASAQTETKPQKLRITASFFDTRYEIGDKTTPKKEVALHLKKHESDAYIMWKGADRANNNYWLWTVVGCVGLLTGAAAEDPDTRLYGYGIGAGGFLISIIPMLNQSSRRQKAIDIYNTKFGY